MDSRSVRLFHKYKLLDERAVMHLLLAEDRAQSQHFPRFVIFVVQVAAIVIALGILPNIESELELELESAFGIDRGKYVRNVCYRQRWT